MTASFPIVGVGASAGGLEAFTQLLAALPSDTGMAFVVVQHLDPSHESYLSAALAKTTSMPVREIKDGMRVERDHVYVIPPNAKVELRNGILDVLPRRCEPGKPHAPIDFLFRSLAADRKSQAIGVVLSGLASDGSEGLTAIKAEGGVALAQDPQTARFDGMPRSAIATGVVDFTGAVPELADEIVRLGLHPILSARPPDPFTSGPDQLELRKIFALVRNAIGVDLGDYKAPTICRRLARRLALKKIDTLGRYASLLRDDPSEAQALFDDVLIHMTSFFRDGELFDELKSVIFPELVEQKPPELPLRVWVTGCSTGEEAYSFAIALSEYLREHAKKRSIQVFGSDVGERAIDVARAGVYVESAVRNLSRERLERFFTRMEGGYRVSQSIRDLCVFARHDLVRDPPFSRLDLVSCRNVLIYLEQPVQRRVIATFHHCLNQPGYLVLGRSEAIAGQSELFSPKSATHKIFARAATPTTRRFTNDDSRSGLPLSPSAAEHVAAHFDLARHVDGLLFGRYLPPAVVVDEKLDIVLFRGNTAPYLEHPSGRPQSNLLTMAREGLSGEIRLALDAAKKTMKVVRRDGVRVHQDRSTRLCNLVVLPVGGVTDRDGRIFAVVFEEPAAKRGRRDDRSVRPTKRGRSRPPPGRNAARAEELDATHAHLRSLVEEHQHVNDAFASANQELVSSNEELQSMNEELETAKQELQSANEELSTLNDEFQYRNQELDRLNNDLVNLLDSVEIPIVIVDSQRRIRRFTSRARKLLHLLPADVGRPLDDIKTTLEATDLDAQIAETISSGQIRESEVRDRDGRWHRLQIRPYKTIDNQIDGAVLSLVDVDALKRGAEAAASSRDDALGIVQAVPLPLVVVDHGLTIVTANQSFHEFFGFRGERVDGKRLFELGAEWDVPELKIALAESLTDGVPVDGLEFERDFPGRGARILCVRARPIELVEGTRTVLLAIEDATDRKRHELENRDRLNRAEQAQAGAEQASRAKDVLLATVSHELRTPMSSLLMQADVLKRGADPARVKRAAEAIERAATIQAQLVEDLLDVSRIVAGKLRLQMAPVDPAVVVRSALDEVATIAAKKGTRLEPHLDDAVGQVSGDAARLQQVVSNLLVNAIKFTPAGGRVDVRLDRFGEMARIEVSDTGIGIDPELLPKIFDRFFQIDAASVRTQVGLGLGLALVRHITEAHGGSVRAESPGKDRGATFTVLLPLLSSHPKESRPLGR